MSAAMEKETHETIETVVESDIFFCNGEVISEESYVTGFLKSRTLPKPPGFTIVGHSNTVRTAGRRKWSM